MKTTRKALEGIADSSNDKSFAKCMYMIASESRQFENEIHAQISSFNCKELNVFTEENRYKPDAAFSSKSIDDICTFIEENYIKPYKRLLKDKYLNSSLKKLINNHLQAFLFSITQLRLFNEVEPVLN